MAVSETGSSELRLQKETKSGQGVKKRRYIYFENFLFLLPSMENREHRSNLKFGLHCRTPRQSVVAWEEATGERCREYTRRRKPATQKETNELCIYTIVIEKPVTAIRLL
jgi:hypothetical protein